MKYENTEKYSTRILAIWNMMKYEKYETVICEMVYTNILPESYILVAIFHLQNVVWATWHDTLHLLEADLDKDDKDRISPQKHTDMEVRHFLLYNICVYKYIIYIWYMYINMYIIIYHIMLTNYPVGSGVEESGAQSISHQRENQRCEVLIMFGVSFQYFAWSITLRSFKIHWNQVMNQSVII